MRFGMLILLAGAVAALSLGSISVVSGVPQEDGIGIYSPSRLNTVPSTGVRITPVAETQFENTLAAPMAYARLLDDYVVEIPISEEYFESRFDYDALQQTPRQAELRAAIRESFLSVDPDSLPFDVRKAWAVNCYNFLVIDLVVENLYTEAGRELTSIGEVGAGNFEIFDVPLVEIQGNLYSLDSFEARFVFHDVDRESGVIPPELDPRCHFALVCGAKSCPPIWPEPFRPETLDEQLTAATRNALAGPRHFRKESNAWHVGKVFEWYEIDFTSTGGVQDFLQAHGCGEEPPEAIHTDIDWDWSLNRP